MVAPSSSQLLFTLLALFTPLVTATFGGFGPGKFTRCDVSNAQIDLPSGQTQLVLPSGEKPKYIALGLGVQNYTCSSGTFTSTGAVAELIDISCLVGAPVFGSIQDTAFNLFSGFNISVNQIIDRLGGSKLVLGQHYFQPNPFTGTGVSPVFDFRAGALKGHDDAFALMNRTGGIPSPAGSSNVDWLELITAQGTLAKHIFRVDTKAGQPPSSCAANSVISVKYASKYWFFA